MYKVVIEFDRFIVKGWADLCGPYAECEGSEVTSVILIDGLGAEHLGIMHQDFLERALEAVESDAYEQHKKRHARDYESWDGDDRYDDDHHQVGPDYWIDPESGEYRCG